MLNQRVFEEEKLQKFNLHNADLFFRYILKDPLYVVGHLSEIAEFMGSRASSPWHVTINPHLDWDVIIFIAAVDP